MIARAQLIDEISQRLDTAMCRIAGGRTGDRRIEKNAARAQLGPAAFQRLQLQAGIAELPLRGGTCAQFGGRTGRDEEQIGAARQPEALLQFRQVEKNGERGDLAGLQREAARCAVVHDFPDLRPNRGHLVLLAGKRRVAREGARLFHAKDKGIAHLDAKLSRGAGIERELPIEAGRNRFGSERPEASIHAEYLHLIDSRFAVGAGEAAVDEKCGSALKRGG